MPQPSPGRKTVPRWRTMISPPVTVSPANIFTRSRWLWESRPFLDEPRPFLCATFDLPDRDARQLLTVTRRALVAALGLELEDPDLRTTFVADDLGRNGGLLQRIRVECGRAGVDQQRLELNCRASLFGKPLYEQLLAGLDAILLTAGFDDRVCHLRSLNYRKSSQVRGTRASGGAHLGAAEQVSLRDQFRFRRPASAWPVRPWAYGPAW